MMKSQARNSIPQTSGTEAKSEHQTNGLSSYFGLNYAQQAALIWANAAAVAAAASSSPSVSYMSATSPLPNDPIIGQKASTSTLPPANSSPSCSPSSSAIGPDHHDTHNNSKYAPPSLKPTRSTGLNKAGRSEKPVTSVSSAHCNSVLGSGHMDPATMMMASLFASQPVDGRLGSSGLSNTDVTSFDSSPQRKTDQRTIDVSRRTDDPEGLGATSAAQEALLANQFLSTFSGVPMTYQRQSKQQQQQQQQQQQLHTAVLLAAALAREAGFSGVPPGYLESLVTGGAGGPADNSGHRTESSSMAPMGAGAATNLAYAQAMVMAMAAACGGNLPKLPPPSVLPSPSPTSAAGAGNYDLIPFGPFDPMSGTSNQSGAATGEPAESFNEVLSFLSHCLNSPKALSDRQTTTSRSPVEHRGHTPVTQPISRRGARGGGVTRSRGANSGAIGQSGTMQWEQPVTTPGVTRHRGRGRPPKSASGSAHYQPHPRQVNSYGTGSKSQDDQDTCSKLPEFTGNCCTRRPSGTASTNDHSIEETIDDVLRHLAECDYDPALVASRYASTPLGAALSRKRRKAGSLPMPSSPSPPPGGSTGGIGGYHVDTGEAFPQPCNKRARIAPSAESGLRLPLALGWRRETLVKGIGPGGILGEVIYVSPCGRRLWNLDSVREYLKSNNVPVLSVDDFCFKSYLRLGDYYECSRSGQSPQTYVKMSEAAINSLTSAGLREPDDTKTAPGSTTWFPATSFDSTNGVVSAASSYPTVLPPAAHAQSSGPHPSNMSHFLSDLYDVPGTEIARPNCFTSGPNDEPPSIPPAAHAASESGSKVPASMPLLDPYFSELRLNAPVPSLHLPSDPRVPSLNMDRSWSQLGHPMGLLPTSHYPLGAKGPSCLDPVVERDCMRNFFIHMAKERIRSEERKRAQYQHAMLEERERALTSRVEERIEYELKKTVDDLRLMNSKELPNLEPIPGLRLSSQAFADCLEVLEFLHAFTEILCVDSETIPTLGMLQAALVDREPECLRAVLHLLVELLKFAILDPGLPSSRLVTQLLGQRFSELEVNAETVTGLLRVFLIGRNGYEDDMSDWLKPPCHFIELSADQQASLLAFVCDELVSSSRLISTEVDRTIELQAALKREKWVLESKIRRLRFLITRKFGPGTTNDADSISKGPTGALTTPCAIGSAAPEPMDNPTDAHLPEEDAIDAGSSSPHQSLDGSTEGANTNVTISNRKVDTTGRLQFSRTSLSRSTTPEIQDVPEKVSGFAAPNASATAAAAVSAAAIASAFLPGDEEETDDLNQLEAMIESLSQVVEYEQKAIDECTYRLSGVFLGQDRYYRRYYMLGHLGGIFVQGASNPSMESATFLSDQKLSRSTDDSQDQEDLAFGFDPDDLVAKITSRHKLAEQRRYKINLPTAGHNHQHHLPTQGGLLHTSSDVRLLESAPQSKLSAVFDPTTSQGVINAESYKEHSDSVATPTQTPSVPDVVSTEEAPATSHPNPVEPDEPPAGDNWGVCSVSSKMNIGESTYSSGLDRSVNLASLPGASADSSSGCNGTEFASTQAHTLPFSVVQTMMMMNAENSSNGPQSMQSDAVDTLMHSNSSVCVPFAIVTENKFGDQIRIRLEEPSNGRGVENGVEDESTHSATTQLKFNDGSRSPYASCETSNLPFDESTVVGKSHPGVTKTDRFASSAFEQEDTIKYEPKNNEVCKPEEDPKNAFFHSDEANGVSSTFATLSCKIRTSSPCPPSTSFPDDHCSHLSTNKTDPTVSSFLPLDLSTKSKLRMGVTPTNTSNSSTTTRSMETNFEQIVGLGLDDVVLTTAALLFMTHTSIIPASVACNDALFEPWKTVIAHYKSILIWALMEDAQEEHRITSTDLPKESSVCGPESLCEAILVLKKSLMDGSTQSPGKDSKRAKEVYDSMADGDLDGLTVISDSEVEELVNRELQARKMQLPVTNMTSRPPCAYSSQWCSLTDSRKLDELLQSLSSRGTRERNLAKGIKRTEEFLRPSLTVASITLREFAAEIEQGNQPRFLRVRSRRGKGRGGSIGNNSQLPSNSNLPVSTPGPIEFGVSSSELALNLEHTSNELNISNESATGEPCHLDGSESNQEALPLPTNVCHTGVDTVTVLEHRLRRRVNQQAVTRTEPNGSVQKSVTEHLDKKPGSSVCKSAQDNQVNGRSLAELLGSGDPLFVKECCFLEEVEALEDRVLNASLQVKGWQAPAKVLDDETVHLIPRTTPKRSRFEHWPLDLARTRLLNLESHLERRYLLPPLNSEVHLDIVPDQDTGTVGEGSRMLSDSLDPETGSESGFGGGPGSESTNTSIRDWEAGSNGAGYHPQIRRVIGKQSVTHEQTVNPAPYQPLISYHPTDLPESTNYLFGSLCTEQLPPGLLEWRHKLHRATEVEAMRICLDQLTEAIAWDKSIMKVLCQICRRDNNEAQLLLCDGCDHGYHTYCFRPPLVDIPPGDWFCFDCVSKATGKSICFTCGLGKPTYAGGSTVSQTSTDASRLLICECCSRAVHVSCSRPPITRIPRRWTCANCSTSGNANLSTSQKQGKQQSTATTVACTHTNTGGKHTNSVSPEESVRKSDSTSTSVLAQSQELTTKVAKSSKSATLKTKKPSGSALSSSQHSSSTSSMGTRVTTPRPQMFTKRPSNSTSTAAGLLNKLKQQNKHRMMMKNIRLEDKHGLSGTQAKCSRSHLVGDVRHFRKVSDTNPTHTHTQDDSDDLSHTPSRHSLRDSLGESEYIFGKEDEIPKKMLTPSEISWCRMATEDLINHEASWAFRKPVNLKQVPFYRKIIKCPMDLSTIQRKTRHPCSYSTLEEWRNDVRLIFDNCEIFNEDDSDVGRAGHTMRAYFESRWSRPSCSTSFDAHVTSATSVVPTNSCIGPAQCSDIGDNISIPSNSATTLNLAKVKHCCPEPDRKSISEVASDDNQSICTSLSERPVVEATEAGADDGRSSPHSPFSDTRSSGFSGFEQNEYMMGLQLDDLHSPVLTSSETEVAPSCKPPPSNIGSVLSSDECFPASYSPSN